jgi:hypothetical protein
VQRQQDGPSRRLRDRLLQLGAGGTGAFASRSSSNLALVEEAGGAVAALERE